MIPHVLATVVGAEGLTDDLNLDTEALCAFGADLMSDVLTYAQPGALLRTGLASHLEIPTAETSDRQAPKVAKLRLALAGSEGKGL